MLNICCLTRAGFDCFPDDKRARVYLMPFFSGKPISYSDELNNKSFFYRDMALVSKQLNAAVICGLDTDSFGVIRHSAAVFSGGRMLGVSDMMNVENGGKYTAGGAVKVYQAAEGKIGVLVGADLFDYGLFRSLTDCDADVIVCVYERALDNMPQLMVRVRAYEFGIPVCLSAHSFAAVASASGELSFSSADAVEFRADTDRKYRLNCRRFRGAGC